MKHLRIGLISLALGALLAFGALSGCTSAKDILYFQDISKYENRKIEEAYEPVIMKDDKLQIIVSGPDKSVVSPYNLTLSDNTNGSMNASTAVIPYLVDSRGYIEMPGLGPIKAEGMRRIDLVNYITEQLTSKGLVKDPVVSVSFLNFRVTVLGEVRNPGTFTVPSERITVLQALGMAGDLQITADRHNLILLRDVDGVHQHYFFDLTQSDVIYFYMQQNDVLYVPQSATRIAQGTTATTLWSIILSSTTTLLTVATFLISILGK